MDTEKQREKQKNKLKLLERLKSLKVKTQNTPLFQVPIYDSQPKLIQNPEPKQNQKQLNTKNELPKTTSLELGNKIFQNLGNIQQKYQQMSQKQEEIDKSALKISNNVTRPKRPYYEHYSKQGVFQPMLDYVRNHPNPSGKPPNIPQTMYNGIQVVPKRPWVYFGPQNVPPSDCQEINEKNFTVIFEKVKAQKKLNSGILKKSNKKKGHKRNDDDISQISQQYTSNFTFSDSVDLSRESDLISEFRSQTKTLKQYDSGGNASQSQAQDDHSSMSGSVTQRHRYNLFDSSESQEEESNQDQKRKNQYKKILQQSDQQQSQAVVGSSLQGSSINLNAGSATISNQQKGSSGKVKVDENQSQISMSKSKSQNKANKKNSKKQAKNKKKKSKLSIDSSQDD